MLKCELILLAACTIFAGCTRNGKVLGVDEAKYVGYSKQANEKAREQRLGIGMEIADGELFVPGVYVPDGSVIRRRIKCTMAELEARVRNTISSRRIDCAIAPVAVFTHGQVRFGQVAAVFDLCNGLGFNVFGFCSMAERPPIACVPGPIVLPLIGNGVAFEANAKYGNCVEVKIDAGGHIVVDGSVVLDGNDVREDSSVLKKHLLARFPEWCDSEKCGQVVCLIFADKDVHVEHVDHAATATMLAGCSFVAMVGVCKDGCKYMRFTTPVPDATYWNYGEAW